MPVVRKSALVLHSAKQMYDLVCDFESYPDFLPWCSDSRLLSRTAEKLCGELEVSRMGIRQRFATCNHLVENERMDIELLEGPFRQFSGNWKFDDAAGGGCDVVLALDFEMASLPLKLVFEAVFEELARSQIDAFVARAGEVYG